MKCLRSTLYATILTLALTPVALAGDIGSPRIASAGDIGSPRLESTGDIGSPKLDAAPVAGDIGSPKADFTVDLFALVLFVIW